MVDICMLIAISRMPYRLNKLAIDDHDQQYDRNHYILLRWRGSRGGRALRDFTGIRSHGYRRNLCNGGHQ